MPGVQKLRPLQIGGITKYRGRILPNMSVPPPVVNDMSHRFGQRDVVNILQKQCLMCDSCKVRVASQL